MEKIKDFLFRFCFPMLFFIMGVILFILYMTGNCSFFTMAMYEFPIVVTCVTYIVLECRNAYDIVSNILGSCIGLACSFVLALVIILVWNPFSETKQYELTPLSEDIYYASPDTDLYYFEYSNRGRKECMVVVEHNGKRHDFSLSEYEIVEDKNVEKPCIEMKAYKDLSGVYKGKILIPLKIE